MKHWRKNIIFVGALLVCALSACTSTKSLEGKYADNSASSTTASQVDQGKRNDIGMQLAIGYYQQGQFKIALDEIKKILQTDPNVVDAYSVRALIFMATGEKQAAEDNFLHALKLAPNNSDIANNYGWFLCQNGRERQSISYFEKAIKDPSYLNPAKTLNMAGVCSLKLKDVVAAERYFNQGFREDPGNPSINANLAKILFDRGEYEKAQFYINRVLKAEVFAADVLWLGIKIENKLGDEATVASLGTQLRRRFPDSIEYAQYQRGAFNE